MIRAALAIAWKDLTSLRRDKAGLFFTLFFPILVALFFGAIFRGGGGGSMRVAVVNEDGGPASVAFAADLKADSSIKVVDVIAVDSDADANVTLPMTREHGLNLVRRGDVVACVIVPKGFEEDSKGFFAGRSIKIEAVVAPGRNAEAGLITGKLNEIAFKGMSRVFTDTSAMTSALDNAKATIARNQDMPAAQKLLFGTMFNSVESLRRSFPDSVAGTGQGADSGGGPSWRPITVTVEELKSERKTPRSSWEMSFAQGVVWGLMGCVTGFGVSITQERSRGTLMRLTTAPIGRGTILAGKALACFTACILVQVVLLTMAVTVLGVRPSNVLMMAVAMVVSAAGFVGVMMLLAGLSRTEGGAAGLGRAMMIVLALIGGGSVPLFILPPFVQTISSVSPFKWTTLAIEGALWRTYSWGEFAVPAGVLLAFGVGGLVIGTLSLRWTDR